jgi:hypothetical protein
LRLRLHAESPRAPLRGRRGKRSGPAGRRRCSPARGVALEAASTLTTEEWERLCESLETQG